MSGEITLYIGCMFAEKTSSLLRDLRRSLIANKKCLSVKPSIDNRYSDNKICSHNGKTSDAKSINSLSEVDNIIKNYDNIFIDEGQFFDDIVTYADKWADQGKKIVISALDGTSDRVAFGKICDLIPKCENVHKLKAICIKCSKNASFTLKMTESKKTIDIGGSDKYIAVCRKCFNKHSK